MATFFNDSRATTRSKEALLYNKTTASYLVSLLGCTTFSFLSFEISYFFKSPVLDVLPLRRRRLWRFEKYKTWRGGSFRQSDHVSAVAPWLQAYMVDSRTYKLLGLSLSLGAYWRMKQKTKKQILTENKNNSKLLEFRSFVISYNLYFYYIASYYRIRAHISKNITSLMYIWNKICLLYLT